MRQAREFLEKSIGISKISAYGELCRYQHNPPPGVINIFEVPRCELGHGKVADKTFIRTIAELDSGNSYTHVIKVVAIRW